MADNELTFSARISELETQVAELQGHLTQINQSVAQGNCLTSHDRFSARPGA